MSWTSTYLHNPSGYGDLEPAGEGPYGGTTWEQSAEYAAAWASTFLHNPSGYGDLEPAGEGPYGGTQWERAL